jgi:PAS domain S-box-containing protein
MNDMGISDEEWDHAARLRKRAEEALRGKPVEVNDLTSEDIQYLLHELQVHQAELSIQNEDLRHTQEELELSRDLYSDLYNFAPVGYCTIDHKGSILNANHTLADLLGVEHAKLIHERFAHFVAREDQDTFFLYCQRAFERPRCLSGEIRLVKPSREITFVRLESMISHGDEKHLLVMVIDSTQQRQLQHRLAEQREKERQKIGQDLHDGPVQALAAINFTLQGMIADKPDEKLIQSLHAIQASVREQIQVLRSYSVDLRPPLLVHLGLEKAIRSHAEGFQDRYPKISLQLELHLAGTVLKEDISQALFRIFQEALLNIAKHALLKTTKMAVRLEKVENQLWLEIEDNGEGFDLPVQWLDLVKEGHLGILNMREQAVAVGGQIKIISKRGTGTHILVTVPLNNSYDSQHPT